MDRRFKLFWDYNLPRWSILFIDTLICAFSLGLAFVIRFDFNSIPEADAKNLPYNFVVVLGIRFLSFAVSKTYKGVVRYTSSRDTVRIFTVIVSGSILIFIINVISLYFIIGYYFIANSVIIIDALVSLFIMISSRLAVKALYFEIKNPADAFLPKQNVSSRFIFAREDKFFAYPNNFNHYVQYYKNTFQHGGVSLEEMIIPYITLTAK